MSADSAFRSINFDEYSTTSAFSPPAVLFTAESSPSQSSALATSSNRLFATPADLPDWLVGIIDQRYGDQFGETFGHVDADSQALQLNDAVADNLIAAYTVAALDYSRAAQAVQSLTVADSTNVQVEGVDEPDLVETDGEVLFMIARRQLIVVDVRDPANLRVLYQARLEDRPLGMFLAGDRLVVTQDGLFTDSISVFDVSNPARPQLVQQTTIPGKIIDSRLVDGKLRIVAQDLFSPLEKHLPSLNIETVSINADGTLTERRYLTREAYLEEVCATLSTDLLPQSQSFAGDGSLLGTALLLDPSELRENRFSGQGYLTTISEFDITQPSPIPTAYQAVLTRSSWLEIYSNADNLYLFARNDQTPGSPRTDIWKFRFSGPGNPLANYATGQVSGVVDNQFASDEHDGYLRLVADVGWGVSQNLYVLQQQGDKLLEVGGIEGLAPGESLHAVRFAGSRAFVVTLHGGVDPLFAIDLSEPTNPSIVGTLQIDGFSEYLQPLDENHLLAVARTTNSLGQVTGEQISIFDVTDLANPFLVDQTSFSAGAGHDSLVIGTGFSRSDGDHHALSYFVGENLIALPAEVATNSSTTVTGNSTEQVAYAPGLQLFRYETSHGLERAASIIHKEPIVRSVCIGNVLVAVSAGSVSTHSLQDPTEQLDVLDIQQSTSVIRTPPRLPDSTPALSQPPIVSPPVITPKPPISMLPVETPPWTPVVLDPPIVHYPFDPEGISIFIPTPELEVMPILKFERFPELLLDPGGNPVRELTRAEPNSVDTFFLTALNSPTEAIALTRPAEYLVEDAATWAAELTSAAPASPNQHLFPQSVDEVLTQATRVGQEQALEEVSDFCSILPLLWESNSG